MVTSWQPAPSSEWRLMLAHAFQRRSVLWLLGIGIASLAGALVVPISDLGRVTPASVTRQWLFLFLICWTGLSG